MLEGIKVLSESTVDFSKIGLFMIVLGSFGLMICMIALFQAICDKNRPISILAIIVGIFMVAIIIIGASCYCEEPLTKYKVTIDDTVKLKEFNDRYEIKDQDGKIYTIVEREEN